ncbi:MAG: asparagine synthase (glutamine-hydrolyzing), partial [Pyrinomonadaceae bacterium]|nr:asparagine synthase (glutamine-hydrolyzing) [Pyrinomonadaceae bacterium]
FNGEIYNFQEIRQHLTEKGISFYTNSDTEAIVNLYQLYGADCVDYLRGMFAFAIWDETEQSLFIARDRVGKKPVLYSYQPNGDLIFGSEFQAVLQHPNISREVDYEAIDSYLSYLCVPAPQTAFKSIRKLEPGHWLLWKNGEIKTHRYWQPDFSKKIKISEAEAIEETTRIVREATKLRMISEVPLGAFLSGGVDSSVVVALMAELSDKPVKTFSIGFEEQDFSELKYAKAVANHVGAEYNEFIVRPNALEILPTLVEHYGEPYADSSAIPTYYVSKETRKYVTVALNGDGGDESFAGYERYFAMNLAEKYRKIPNLVRKGLIETSVGLLPNPTKYRSRLKSLKRFVEAGSLSNVERYLGWMSAISPSLKNDLVSKNFRANLNGNKPIDVLQKWFNKTEGLGIIDATMFTDQMSYLPNDLLPKVDIASMAVSLEARSPLLDHKVIEFAASLPQNIKINGTETKSLLKKVAAKLVPKEVIYRRKMGFGVPIGSWIRKDMNAFVRETLLSEKFAKRDLFNQAKVVELLDKHDSNKEDFATPIWTLLMLEMWFQKFID